jgi:hypothetical protein
MAVRALLLALAFGLALVALGSALELNVWRAQRVKSLLGSGDPRSAPSVDIVPASGRDLVLEALRRVEDADGGAASRRLLGRAIDLGAGDGGQETAIIFEQQAERWNARGDTGRARDAFAILLAVADPRPELYARIAEHFFTTGDGFGWSYVELFRKAVRAPSRSARDDAYKAIAETRLCQSALENDHDGAAAEGHCRAALDLDRYGVVTTYHTPLARLLLGKSLAAQGRRTEASEVLTATIDTAPNGAYQADALDALASEVFDPDGRAIEATAARLRAKQLREGQSVGSS